MTHLRNLLLICILAVASGNSFAQAAPAVAATPDRVSEFGVYEGYSKARFSEWVTTSQYIETRDGTRLAADISRPSVNGVAVDERFPVLWTYLRYHRRWNEKPNIDNNPMLQRLIREGYVIVAVNVRGGGASFGRYLGLFSAAETRDAYDVIDWLSKQPYSDGNVGMYGVSYMCITQYMAASTKHPALKAIVPENGYFNFYDALRPGGILRSDMVTTWAEATRYLDKEKPPVPVDADTDGSLARAAVLEHATNFDPVAPLGEAKFRDSTAPEFDWVKDMPSAVMAGINQSGVAIYHLGAWFDPYTMSTLLLDANYSGPERLAMGPWAHVTSTDEESEERRKIWGAEMNRWYDYWLKGIDNGVMDDPKIHLALVDIPQKKWSWISLKNLPGQDDRITLYLSGSASAGTPVADDRGLVEVRPASASTRDYQVDPETTTGTSTRWDSNFGGKADYPDLTANDRRSLTFTTPPLQKDLVIVGAPVVTLYMDSSKPDADVHVLLEEVEQDGVSHYVTEGMLRASLRKLAQPPWNNLGLPWQRADKEDQQALKPGEVVELKFTLIPTSYLFNQGNRLRIAIMGADKDNTEAPIEPDALLSFHLGGDMASSVSLPRVTEPLQ